MWVNNRSCNSALLFFGTLDNFPLAVTVIIITAPAHQAFPNSESNVSLKESAQGCQSMAFPGLPSLMANCLPFGSCSHCFALLSQPSCHVLPLWSSTGDKGRPKVPDFSLFVVCIFRDRVSLCSPGCHRAYNVNKAGLKLTEISLPLLPEC
jgi:hypothetical protein